MISGLLVCSLPFFGGCAFLNFSTQPTGPLAPIAFVGTPTLPQVIQTINGNTQRVQQLHTETASVSTPGYPTLRATLSVDRPHRFRLQGKLFGPELDLGSNEEVFWFWVKRMQPSVLFARHDQFAQSPARQMLPIEPTWIVDALGLVTLDPGTPHDGPFIRGNGQLEVRSQIRGIHGDVTRTLVIDPSYGWIVEQNITDANNRLLASAIASNHRYYPEFGVSLPHRVEVLAPAANLRFQIEVGQYFINRPFEDPYERWSLPQIAGQTPINLAGVPSGQGSGANSVAASYGNGSAPAYPPDPRIGFRPQVRGYSQVR
jgi:hypothetical protein